MLHEVHKGRVIQTGASKAVIVPPQVWQKLALLRGDLMLMSVWGDLLIMRRATKRMILDVPQIPVSVIPGEPVKET